MRISALLLPLNSSMRQVFFLLLAMAANFAAVPPAAAYWMGGDTGMSLSIGAGNYLLSQQALKSATRSAATKSVPARSAPVPPARPAPDATRFTPTASTAGLDTLVAVYPAAARAQARQGFQQLHAAYPQVARQLDLPLDDVASGLASFLAGSYMAYHNSSLDEAAVKPLAAQLRQALSAESSFARMSNADKQGMYDQLVMLGMMLAVTQSQQQQQPDARTVAELREIGKRFLEGLLRVDADRVRLTRAGLRID